MIFAMTYGPPPAPYAPPAPSRASRGPLVGAAVGGFVLAAVIAIVLVATGVVGGSDSSGVGGSSDSVSLPKTLGTYVRFADASANGKTRGSKQIIAATAKEDAATAKALSDAHDGAGANVQTYADNSLDTIVTVWAVRAPTPRPVLAVVDPAFLGLAAPEDSVQRFGDAWCQVHTGPVPQGKTVQPNDVYVVSCQRSNDSLTVYVRPTGSTGVIHDPKQVTALVDKAWSSVS